MISPRTGMWFPATLGQTVDLWRCCWYGLRVALSR